MNVRYVMTAYNRQCCWKVSSAMLDSQAVSSCSCTATLALPVLFYKHSGFHSAVEIDQHVPHAQEPGMLCYKRAPLKRICTALHASAGSTTACTQQ